MTRVLNMLIVVTFVASCQSEVQDDRRAITSVVSEFNDAVRNNHSDRLLQLFTKDGDYATGTSAPKAAAIAIRQTPVKRLPWDERTRLIMEVQNVRFIRPEIAIVDALQSDRSPMLGTSRSWSCVFIFIHVGPDWKIAAYRESNVIQSVENVSGLAPR